MYLFFPGFTSGLICDGLAVMIFFSSPSFLSPRPWYSWWALKNLVVSFNLYLFQIWSSFFWFLFVSILMLLKVYYFFNFIPQHVISFNFCIQFGYHFFYCYFLSFARFFCQFFSFNILFHLILYHILVLIFLIFFFYIFYIFFISIWSPIIFCHLFLYVQDLIPIILIFNFL